jgi:hypothetical protein
VVASRSVPVSNLDLIAMGWAMICLGVAIAFHVRVVRQLRAAGYAVPWWRQNRFIVWMHYFRLCRQEQRSPWPGLAPIAISFAIGMPGFFYFMLRGR